MNLFIYFALLRKHAKSSREVQGEEVLIFVIEVILHYYKLIMQDLFIPCSSSSQEVLVSVLKNLDPPVCLSVLKFLLLKESADETTKSMKVLHPHLTFAAGGQGGVVIVTKLERFAVMHSESTMCTYM